MKILTLNDYLKNQFGTKVYKLSLSTGASCPNRDGKLSFKGCAFCSEGGSGDFATEFEEVKLQVEKAKLKVNSKFPKSIPVENRKYIAYFQSFTNTYGDEERLKKIFSDAASFSEIVAVSIGTRSDCLSDSMIEFLADLNKKKPVWIELGVQSIHSKTHQILNTYFSLSKFESVYKKIKNAGLTVIVHLILGLPGESEEMILESVKYISNLDGLDGIKLQLLHVLKGTELEKMYIENPFKIFTLGEYCSLVVKCLKLLPENIVVHRITGDGPKHLLIEPQWSGDKKRVLNTLNKYITEA